MYKKAEGCEISWKDNEKSLKKSFEIKKQRNKSAYSFVVSSRSGQGRGARSAYLAVIGRLF